MPPNPMTDRTTDRTLQRLYSGAASEHVRKRRIEVLIRPKPRPLLQPPPKISLVPKHDGTGYIICRVVLPIGAVLEKNARRTMCYVVGWTDMPAAKVTIPAHQIYDYCSPRVVEDWEYREYLKKERQEEERQKAKERAKARKSAGTALRQGQEARPRPPRARQEAQRPPEPKLGKEDQELLAKKKLSGPSLSTPQKRKLAHFFSEDAYQDDDTAIARQLYGDGTDFDSEATGQIVSTETGGSELDESSRASSALPPASRSRSLRLSPARQDVPYSVSSQPQSNGPTKMQPLFSSQLQPSARTSIGVRNPGATIKPEARQEGPHHPEMHSLNKGSGLGSNETANGISQKPLVREDVYLSSILPSQALKANPAPGSLQVPAFTFRGKSSTPIPAPILPLTGPSNWVGSLADGKIRQDVSRPHTTLPTAKIPAQQVSQVNGQHGSSTGSVYSSGKLSNTPTPIPLPTSVTASRNTFLQLHGKKPGTPPVRPSQEAPRRSATPNSQSSKKKRQKAEAVDDDEPVAEAEQQWEVKRLEGDKFFDIDGRPVRHFKVRWAGAWPPDQNPTWEPEENIAAALVRKYLKRQAKRRGNISTPQQNSTPKQSTLSPWTKKYSSVQEAFEAGTDNAPEEGPRVEDDEDEVEQLVVSKEATRSSRPSLGARDSFDLALARQYTTFSRS